jgi:hypothetical protein
VEFRSLRVLNDDRIAAGQGFGMHPHRDMEIITYVLGGKVEHKDSMGTTAVIQPGEVQRMSAGTGVTHSEFNGSDREPAHFLQIWLLPDRSGHRPSYEQRPFPEAERRGKLRLIASPDGADGSTTLHQDARVFATLLGAGEAVELPLAKGRHAWVQVARGELEVNGTRLRAGDGAALSGEARVSLAGVGDELAEALVFDLA